VKKRDTKIKRAGVRKNFQAQGVDLRLDNQSTYNHHDKRRIKGGGREERKG
jgi:hypothetical protein